MDAVAIVVHRDYTNKETEAEKNEVFTRAEAGLKSRIPSSLVSGYSLCAHHIIPVKVALRPGPGH